MSDHNLPMLTENRKPILRQEDGSVFADSRDVAAFFDRRHRDVLSSIDNLIASEPTLALRNFRQGVYSLAETGNQQHRCFEMDRDGFSLLAMGFTGEKALKWKLAYIAAFNAMQLQISKQVEVPDLNDPRQLLKLLTDYANKAIELEGKIEEMMPSVQALDRIALSDGALCITDAAKNLQVSRTKLFAYLREKRWIYKRPDNEADIAFQDKLNAGLLEHKVRVVQKKDGGDLTLTQVRVTSKGLARLGKELSK